MTIVQKLTKLTTGHRHAEEASNWIFSLAPVGVAFCFYCVYMLQMDVANKNVMIVLGAAAGFIGLQSYWVYRGWIRNEGSTVLLSLLGIVLALLLTYGYIVFGVQA